MDIKQLLTIVQNALEDKKAQEITVFDVHNFTSITDFMIVATGTTHRQTKAIAQHVVEQAKMHGYKALGTEGFEIGEWVLIDLCDVIVHVMQPQTRDFYQLEKLWSHMGEQLLSH